MGWLRGRLGRPAIMAALLSVTLVTPALAGNWNLPIALTSSGNAWHGGLAATGISTAIAIYENNGRIAVRRSGDGGVSWQAPLRVAEAGRTPAVAARGANVDAVWETNDRVRYARSTNGGVSFGSSVALSPRGRLVQSPAVARGKAGLVVVAWLQAQTVPCCDGPWNVRVRVSSDGGASFGAAATVGQGWGPVVAAGKGVAYVAHEAIVGSRRGLSISRSTTGGDSWEPPFTFAYVGNLLGAGGSPTLTAAGSVAYVGYAEAVEVNDEHGDLVSFTNWVRYRRTGDRGKTWSPARNLTSSATGSRAANPVFSMRGGVLRTAFTDDVAIYYRQRPEGGSWSAPQLAVSDNAGYETPVGIGFASRVVIAFAGDNGAGGPNIFAASGTP